MGRRQTLETRAKISASRKEQWRKKKIDEVDAAVARLERLCSPAPYKVGYGKPPREHQFKPGQSGNPAGRPSPMPKLRPEDEAAAPQKEADYFASPYNSLRPQTYDASHTAAVQGEAVAESHQREPRLLDPIRSIFAPLNAPILAIETRAAIWLWFIWFVLYLVTWIPWFRLIVT